MRGRRTRIGLAVAGLVVLGGAITGTAIAAADGDPATPPVTGGPTTSSADEPPVTYPPTDEPDDPPVIYAPGQPPVTVSATPTTGPAHR